MTDFGSFKNKYQLVYVGRLQGELGGEYPLYWCRESGTLIERFDGGKCAVLYPAMNRKVAEKFKGVEYVKETRTNFRPPDRVLGKGLQELMVSTPASSKGLAALLGYHKEKESE